MGLVELAAGMERECQQKADQRQPPIAERELGGGVGLRLRIDPDGRHLLLVYRRRVFPSAAEIKVFRNVFKVPEGATQTTKTIQPRGDPTDLNYFFLEWTAANETARV